MSFGQTLRESREAKGLSQSELASKTNLLVQVVNGLENEDFHMIPAPIYGRGFVKLYCEATEIDPKPLQEEFMRLYRESLDAPPKISTARPAPAARESAVTPAPPAADAEPLPPGDATAAELPLSEFAAQAPASEPAKEPPPRKNYGDLFEHAYQNEEYSAKPSAAEKFRDTMSNVSHGVFANVKHLPPNIGRMVTVVVGAILLIALMGWGVHSLYQATSAGSVAETDGDASTAAEPVRKAAAAKPVQNESSAKTAAPVRDPKHLQSTGPKVPSLYID